MYSVKYSGPWAEASGYAQANRNIITSLHEADVDVVTELQVFARQSTDYGKGLKLAHSLQNKHRNYPIKVLHITPDVYTQYKEVGKYHVGHLFWETTGLSSLWKYFIHEVRELWTGCEYNVKCFRNAGFIGPIFKFPQPIDVDISAKPVPIQNAKGFVFYSVFQWSERKDPKSLLTAYWREFEGNDDVTMVIKTYRLSFDEQEKNMIYQDIATWKKELKLHHYPRTLIIDYLLSTEEMYQLHASGDCFVSAHRGEGWGIPQVEALVMKKPVISTGLGGMHEWISDDAMMKVKYKMVPVQVESKYNTSMDWAEQYSSEFEWGQVDGDDLRVKMRQIYADKDLRDRMAKKGNKEARETFNYKHVGDLMKERIAQIYDEQKM